RKASSVKFDWKDPIDVLEKVKEEINELEEVMEISDQDKIEDEIGDVLFSVINLSRFLKVDLGKALKRSSDKFVERFKKIEDRLAESGADLLDSDFSTMDEIWDSIKAGNVKKDN
ncbi:nucleoside triphosphate pyrophosphohydrolase, partial [bacterium]|nr:nucleoside triphosphate pyrophosphohydrolase [bacterium]